MRLPLWGRGWGKGCLMSAKRILSAAMALLLSSSFAAPSGVRAASDAGFEYTVADGAATVTGCTSTCPTTLVIPATLGGYPVTTFSEFAFFDKDLISVTIPDSVTSITRLAFFENDLSSLTIPDSVTTIGQAAFYRNNLTSLAIGNSVTSIGEAAFMDNLLTTVTIPNSVESIGLNAFGYNSLTTVTFGNSITSIGPQAFIGGGGGARGGTGNLLTTVTIPNSVTSIGDYAFSGNALASVAFLGNAPAAGTDVFGNNSELTAVTRTATATGWGATWSGVPVVTDELPPETTLDVTPDSTTSNLVASFEFSGSDDLSSVTFECSVDGGSYVSCASPFSTSALSVGSHTFAVRAVDAVENIDPTPASFAWTIEDDSTGLPPTNREGSDWATLLAFLAALSAIASVDLRLRVKAQNESGTVYRWSKATGKIAP